MSKKSRQSISWRFVQRFFFGFEENDIEIDRQLEKCNKRHHIDPIIMIIMMSIKAIMVSV